MKRSILFIGAVLLLFTTPIWAATYTVTNCADSGAGSLRQAITNASSAGDEIIFDITTLEAGYSTGEVGPGLVTNEAGSNKWFRIIVNSQLPTISTSNIYINGSTQTREAANTLGPSIEVRCVSNEVDAHGLYISTADNCTIEGLVINGFGASLKAGIYLFNNADQNRILNCYIGTTATGEAAYPNYLGISIDTICDFNKIGDGTAGGRNIISGNSNSGISIKGGVSNEVLGNYIGTNATGTADLGNSSEGVYLWTGTQYNKIGGTAAGEGNVISGNDARGIYIFDLGTKTTNYNEILGNYIGTDKNGTTDIANSSYGVYISNGAQHNKIGNGTSGGKNVISGNGSMGIAISLSNSNEVDGNFIGLGSDGQTLITNETYGISISGSQYTRIGKSTSSQRNVIVGDAGAFEGGIALSGATTTNNYIHNNIIGLTSSETAPAVQSGNGIILSSAGTNYIGGTAVGEGNIISGNSANGILINNSTSSEIYGNLIGLKSDGTSVAANGTNGISVIGTSQNNLIGTSESGGRNVIVADNGASDAGIYLSDANVTNNYIYNNLIGLTSNETTPATKGTYGVYLRNGAHHNYIGGIGTDEENIVSGNASFGIFIDGSGTNSNEVLGNSIGTDSSGTTGLGNSVGIYLNNGPRYNKIGNGTAAGRNIISANSNNGIMINGSNSNEVTGNYIGTTASGEADLGNSTDGLAIYNGAQYNIIGGPSVGDRNIISGNDETGIEITTSNANYNQITGNYIGADVNGNDLGNTRYGVHITVDAAFNIIGPSNLIAYNGNASYPDGIRISGATSTHEVITQNSIFGNFGKGIELFNGGNNEIVSPIINSANHNDATGSTLISGIATQEPNGTIEAFKAEGDEGKTYLGSTLADGSGNWSISVSGLVSGDAVVATGTTANPETSEFSQTKEVITTVAKQYQPDNQIATLESGSDYIGAGIYNATGVGQTRTRSIGTGEAATYYIKIGNAGNTSDDVIVTGAGSSGDWTLTYYDAKTGGSNITSQVTGSGWTTALSSGETKEIRMTALNGGTTLSTLEALITSTSSYDGSAVDAVKAATTAAPTPTDLSSFSISGPTTAISGTPFSLTITARDSTGATEETVVGTTNLYVDDGTITPESIAESAFTNGIWTGNVTLSKIGARTITASNEGSTGTAQIIVTNATLEITSSGVTITVPAGASSEEVNVSVSIITDPPGDPPPGYSIGGSIFDIISTPTEYLLPVTVTIPINGPLADGRVYYWNGTAWSRDGINIVTVTTTTLTFTTTHFTVFAPMGALPSNLVRFGPNPYNPNSGTTAKIWYWLDQDYETSIYIVDITGNLVWKNTYAFGTNGGRSGSNSIDFNGKDRWGGTLGDGVYLYKIVQNGKSVGGGKIAIIK
jgi:hypothetical protein